jgi:nucleoside-triphosphatase
LSSDVRAWLLTGPPGIGKSTIVASVIYRVRSKGYGVGGCLTRETRKGKERVGFTIEDLMSGVSGPLASSEVSLGPRVGRYRVDVRGLAEVGGSALREAALRADLIVIDEVGPMELTSPEFRRGVQACLGSGRPVLAVVHEMMKDPLIEEVRALPRKELVEVSLHNRESLPDVLSAQILSVLSAKTPPEGL